MLYDYDGNPVKVYPELVGNGVTDDTVALQALVDSLQEVVLPTDLRILISDSITIDISKCRYFNGSNCTIKVSGDKPAFIVSGSMTSSMTANPSSINSGIMNDEANFVIEKCRITNANAQQGTGIILDGCFKANIKDCYIYKLKTGIAIKNQCRDIKISGNHIYGSWNYGIHIQDTCNLHQCNIENNIINYAYYCIYFDNPVQIANFQIVGNDIETSTYPNIQDKTGFRCIMLDGGSEHSAQFSEIEIVGNTIQGHSNSDSVIEFVKAESGVRYIKEWAIVGNHISNCLKALIKCAYVKNGNISGNNFANAGEYCVALSDYIYSMVISGNVSADASATNGGFLKQEGRAHRVNITGNNSYTSVENPFDLSGIVLSDVVVSGNIIAGTNTSMKVNPSSSATKVMVVNNVVDSGTYTLHNDVTAANNI